MSKLLTHPRSLLIVLILLVGCGEEEVALTCIEAAEALSIDIGSAAPAHQTCDEDVDCILVTVDHVCSDGDSRFGECPIPIASAGRAAFEADVAELGDAICARLDAPCVAGPSCLSTVAACELGRCVARAE